MSKQAKTNIIVGILISIILFIGTSYAANSLYFDDANKGLDTKILEYQTLKATNDTDEKLKANFQKLENDLASAEAEHKVLNRLIPSEGELPIIMSWLRGQAIQRNCKLEKFEPGKALPLNGTLKEVQINCQVLGNFDSASRFLQDFSRYERVLKVRSFSMVEEPKPESDEGTMHATIAFSAYVNDDKKLNSSQK